MWRKEMKNSRRMVQIALLALAFGLTGIFLAAVWRGKPPRQEQPVVPDAGKSQAEMKLTDMEYAEMQEGRQIWTLKAAEADYFQEEQKTLLRVVRLTLYLEDGRQILLESGQGILHAGSKDIELWESVRASLPEGYTLTADRAAYNHEAQTIGSSDEIRLTGPDVDLTGKQWEYRIREHRGSVAAGVSATLVMTRPAAAQQ